MSGSEPTLARRMAGGAVWMVSARMLMRASGLINVMILARLLPPADFGVVGLTVAFIGAFEAMSDTSMTSAIVRHISPKKRHYDTAFTIGVLRGFLIAFTNTYVADFQRDFEFNKDFAYVAIRKLGGSAVSIVTALTIFPDYRALVAGLIAGAVWSVLASFVLTRKWPRFGLGAFGELFNFSKPIPCAGRRCRVLPSCKRTSRNCGTSSPRPTACRWSWPCPLRPA